MRDRTHAFIDAPPIPWKTFALIFVLAVTASAFAKSPQDDHFWQRRGVLIDAVKTHSYLAEYRLTHGPQFSYEHSGGGLGVERRLLPDGKTFYDHEAPEGSVAAVIEHLDDMLGVPPAFRQWRDEFTQEELDDWSDAGYVIPEYTPPMRVLHPESYAIILTQHRRVENGDRDYLFGGMQAVTRSQYEEACAFLGKTP